MKIENITGIKSCYTTPCHLKWHDEIDICFPLLKFPFRISLMWNLQRDSLYLGQLKGTRLTVIRQLQISEIVVGSDLELNVHM